MIKANMNWSEYQMPRAGRRSGFRTVSWALLVTLAFSLGVSGHASASSAEPYGAEARARVAAWQSMKEDQGSAPVAEKLDRVNRHLNRIPYVSDEKHWGRRDYWATPMELLGSGGGDCEDFALAKYFTLTEMGVPAAQLRIVYVKASSLGNIAHMVLAYYPRPDAEPLILDNLMDEIRPASERRDLTSVYSFNAQGLWVAATGGKERRVGSASKLANWRSLKLRLAGQKLPPLTAAAG